MEMSFFLTAGDMLNPNFGLLWEQCLDTTSSVTCNTQNHHLIIKKHLISITGQDTQFTSILTGKQNITFF